MSWFVLSLVAAFVCLAVLLLSLLNVERVSPPAFYSGIATVCLLSAPYARMLLLHARPWSVAVAGPPILAAVTAIVVGVIMRADRGDDSSLSGLKFSQLGLAWPVGVALLGACLGIVGSLALGVPLGLALRRKDAAQWLAFLLWLVGLAAAAVTTHTPWGAFGLGFAALGTCVSAVLLLPHRLRDRTVWAGPYRS